MYFFQCQSFRKQLESTLSTSCIIARQKILPYQLRTSESLIQKEVSYVILNVLEWFSFECRKTKIKVVTLANHKEHRQYSEPIKTRGNYMWLTQSAGKCMRAILLIG